MKAPWSPREQARERMMSCALRVSLSLRHTQTFAPQPAPSFPFSVLQKILSVLHIIPSLLSLDSPSGFGEGAVGRC